MTDGRTSRWLALGVLAGLLFGTPALATNGMYLAGYGAEAAGRGGANIAIADRALGLQANPAGIAQLRGNHLSVDLQFLAPELQYNGPYGEIDGEDRIFTMPSISYVHGGADSKLAWGVGLVSQGGMGATFKGYNTPAMTVDDTYSQVRFLTVVPTVAYSITEDFSIGLSANLGYSDVAFDFWPDSPNGLEMTDPAKAFNYSFRGGLMFRVHPMLQLGLVYQTETKGDYKDGTLVIDYGPAGKYAFDADVNGFTWPEQFGFGVQLRPTERWMLAVDVKTYLWGRSLGTISVQPGDPVGAPPPVAPPPQIPFVFDWKDQIVAIVGLEYRLNHAVTLRAGYNQGNNPVPNETVTPLFPAIEEKHATLGVGWNLQSWTINGAIEKAFPVSQTNTGAPSPINPFAGSTVTHEQWTLSLGFTKVFSSKKAKGVQ